MYHINLTTQYESLFYLPVFSRLQIEDMATAVDPSRSVRTHAHM